MGAVRVLVVGNDRRVRAAVRSLLATSTGVEVVADAADTATALALVRDRRPDVVLVDVLRAHELDLVGVLAGEGMVRVIAVGDRVVASGAYRFLDRVTAPDLMVEAVRAAGAVALP